MYVHAETSCVIIMFHREISSGVILYFRTAKEVPSEVTWKELKSFLNGTGYDDCLRVLYCTL